MPKVIVKNNRVAYADIISAMGLDSIVSPKAITCANILRYVRGRGNAYGTKLERLYRLVNGKAEALEFIPKGTDPYIGIPLRSSTSAPARWWRSSSEGKVIVPLATTTSKPATAWWLSPAKAASAI